MRTVLIAFAILVSFSSMAQNFGHVNKALVIESMPEMASAQQELQDYSNSLEKEFKKTTIEYEEAIAYLGKNKADLTLETREFYEKKIFALGDRIQEFQATAQEKLESKESEILNAIGAKAQNAIQAVATEKGYDYVLDSSTGILLVVPNNRDITELVKKKLGI